jgi:hypothetical protein
MKVGVLFPARIGDPGELLADARALEAAGADSVWFDHREDIGIDPLIALAAIAAVTNDLRLGLLARDRADSDAQQRRLQTLRELSRGRLIPASERWRQVELPADLDAWRDLRADADDQEGLIVPQDPRLLDMLRNGDETIDRTDLQLALG